MHSDFCYDVPNGDYCEDGDFEENAEMQLYAAIDYETGKACSENHSASFVNYSERGKLSVVLSFGVGHGQKIRYLH